MKVAVVYNRDLSGVINVSKVQNKETYDPSTVEAVAAALERGGHTVRLIDGNMHIIERLREFMPRVVAGERPGMVFNLAYGIQGVSRYTHLPAMLEMLGVPYVGSNPQAHALALDKIIAKILFQSEGVSTPKFWNFASPDDSYPDITFPVIVKPKMEGMSLGIKLVRNAKELRAAVSQIIGQFKQHVLVEQFIVGREFTVGLLGNGDVEALPVVELDLEGDPKKIRVDEGSRPLRKICPAPLSKAQTTRLQDMARKSFLALGLQDYARIDVRMDEAGTPYVLEINSMADLGRDGAYVFSAKQAGYDFDALINRVLNVAAVRHFGGEAGARPVVTRSSTRTSSDAEKRAATIRSYVRSQATSTGDSLLKLAELQSPAEILAHVEGQLGLAGLSRRHKKRGATGDYAFFSNYSGAAPGIILAADVGSLGYRALRFSEDGNRVYGPAEGLGGVAIGISALRALRFARLLGDLRCGFLLVWGDVPEAKAHPALTSALSRARAVLGLGSSALDGSLVNARAGEGEYQLFGRPGRTMSRVLAAAVVADFMDRMTALQQLTDPKSGVEVMLSRIDIDSVGAVPQRLEAGFGVRFPTSRDGAAVDARIRKIVDRRAVAKVGYDLTGAPHLPPLVESRASRDLLDRIQTLAKEVHAGLPAPRTAGPSRLGALAETRPCVDGFGPAAGQSEAGEPFLVRSSLQDRTVLLALAIHRLSVNGAR